MNTYGDAYRVTIFGSSHGGGVGCVVDGLPAGMPIDLRAVQRELDRRRPGQSRVTSKRKEPDRVEVLDGLLDGRAAGLPLAFFVPNEDVDSSTYDAYREIPRPGHADFPARVKYLGRNDPRGGGQFSGRMTVGIVIAGAVARQPLAAIGIGLVAHASQVGRVRLEREMSFDEIGAGVEKSPVRCADVETALRMEEEIDAARRDGDSVGGVIECRIAGLPVGVGEPFFDPLEGAIARLAFAIPAVKGIEFGAGFAAAAMRGSEHNDPYVVKDGLVLTETNHAGGIQGGLSNGMPVVFRVVVKPTATIAKAQRSVDLRTMESAEIRGKGRHDPCIVPRAVPVIENAAAIAVLDLVLLGGFLEGTARS